jgi:3-hydroxyisobutyrate dehydrogenase
VLEDNARPQRTVGIVGLGRLGLVVADRLLQAGYPVVCCARGRSAELVERGGRIAGDGTPRAVAEACDVLFTCLPSTAIEAAFAEPDGVLGAAGRLPVVLELSTAPIELKQRLRGQLVEHGSDLLDCPVSGTPAMVESGLGVIYASGDAATYSGAAHALTAVSPGLAYLGEFGTGSKMKYVANLLVLVHVTAAAEAMALARALGLDLPRVAELISASPAAVSGQFKIRAPMIAGGRFDGTMVTVRDAREVLGHVASAARGAGVRVPLASVAKDLLDEFGDEGEDDSDPGKLIQFLVRAEAADDVPAPREARRHARLHVAMSRLAEPGAGPPPSDVLREHLAWMARLEAAGSVFAAGPVVDDDSAILGDGVYIVRADSIAEAKKLLAGDPMHRSGHRTCEVFGWEPHQGRIVLSAALTDIGTAVG